MMAGRRLQVSPVFDTYWRFAALRQEVFWAKAVGVMPTVVDSILRDHRFTNCYRAADRVSQFAIAEVGYGGSQDPRDVVFRMLLFKVFNKIDTWRLLDEELGPITWRGWRPRAARAVLDTAWAAGRRLYSPAYVIPPPRLGGVRKHHDHLLLVETMMRDGVPAALERASCLSEVFGVLRGYPGIGDFLGYQFTIDVNYTSVLDFGEDEFVVAGPGARDGIRKCFGPAATGIEARVISYIADHQQEYFARLGLESGYLGGRALQLVDCQNLFCEVDKYARVAHPEVAGISGRTTIKQQYRPAVEALARPWFPPKWGINDAVAAQLAAVRAASTSSNVIGTVDR
jgi:hypothetical protein